MPQISAGSDIRFHELNPLFAGYDRCCPGHSFGPAVREYYLLHYIFEGKGTYWVEGKEYALSAGECFLIKPGQMTRYQADMEDPWYYVWIGFEGSLAEEFAQLPPVLKFSPGNFYDIRRCELIQNTRKEYLTGILFRLYCEIFSGRRQSRDYAGEVWEYIHYNYMSNITVEGLAGMVNVDRRYLSRLFKAQYGKTLKQFLMEYRMEKAKEFLKEGYIVSTVSDMVGYRDTCNFSKMFKQVTGKSPASYRKECAGKENTALL